jgi:hypothetical protein
MIHKPKKKSKKSNVSKWTEFSDTERNVIYERDKYICAIPTCNSTYMLGVAHIFKTRVKGGAGNRLNGVLLCQHHHSTMDNQEQGGDSILEFCQDYLIQEYGTIDIEKLVFKKWNHI